MQPDASYIQFTPKDYSVVVKIGFSNAFNSLHRKHMLETVFGERPFLGPISILPALIQLSFSSVLWRLPTPITKKNT